MSDSQSIRAKVSLPCIIRAHNGTEWAWGTSEFLTRHSFGAHIHCPVCRERLPMAGNIVVAVELPRNEQIGLRWLELLAIISGAHRFGGGARIIAEVERMTVTSRYRRDARNTGSTCVCQQWQPSTVPERSRTSTPVILRNHSPISITEKEDPNMSFLKKFVVEESGQDMVEYGLVIALVVLAAGAILTGFKTNIGTAFTALGTNVTTNIK